MYLSGRVKDVLWAYLKKNILVYALAIIVFVLGVTLGAIAVKALTVEQKQELIGYLSQFFNSLEKGTIAAKHDLARQAIFSNLKTIAIIWLMGITIIGIPVVLAVLFTRGFVIGFTVGFLAQEMVLKGVIFAIAAVLPHNLITIPALIVASVAAISFSALLIKKKFFKNTHNLRHCFLGYLFLTLAIALVCVIASLVEAYITPVFMKWVTSYLV